MALQQMWLHFTSSYSHSYGRDSDRTAAASARQAIVLAPVSLKSHGADSTKRQKLAASLQIRHTDSHTPQKPAEIRFFS